MTDDGDMCMKHSDCPSKDSFGNCAIAHASTCKYQKRYYAKENDPINHPAHYTFGGIEVLDAIEAWRLPYHLGNVVKYVARAGHKDPSKEIEDLKKAQVYLERYINMVEAKGDKA